MEATAQATPQQAQAKATLDAQRARDRRKEKSESTSGADLKLAQVVKNAREEALRLSLDRTVAATSFTGIGLLVTWLILNARSLGTILKKTRLGVIRFNAKSVLDMLPNIQKLRPFTFTPTLGLIATGTTNLLLGLAVTLIFLASFIPIYILTNPIDAVRIFGVSIIRLFF